MTTNLKILSKFLVLLKIEAASHGLASFEQASYIAKWCNKNKVEDQILDTDLDSFLARFITSVIRFNNDQKVHFKASPSMDSEGFHRNCEIKVILKRLFVK